MRYVPYSVWFMIAVTGLYLSVEVPFAAYLLHIMGGQSSSDDIHAVEEFGRILTGVAVFIAVLGYMIPRFVYNRTPFFKAVFKTAIVGAVTIYGTFQLLNFYGSIAPEMASEEELRAAYVGMLARRVVAENGLGDLAPDQNDAAWRAFVATTAVTSDVETLLDMARTDTKTLIAKETVRTVGDMNVMRERFFGGAFDKVRQSYNDYVEGSNEYHRAVSRVEDEGAREWNAYISDLRARFPGGIPRRGWTTASIRNKVMARIPVSSNWDIVDRHGFMAAYRKAAMKQIKSAYADEITSLLGSDAFIAPGLSFNEFLADNDVQKIVRENLERDLGIDIGKTVISEQMSQNSFEQAVYRPYLSKVRDDLSDVALNFDDRLYGQKLEIAKKAYQAATLPATALLLSLAGAALHVFKFTSYLAQALGYVRGNLAYSHGRRKFLVGTIALLSGATLMLISGDRVTSSEAYRTVSKDTIYTAVLQNAVSIQPSFAHFSEALSVTGLWSVVSAELPAPKPYEAGVSNEITASTDRDIELPVDGAKELGVKHIPVPLPRPTA